MGVGELHPGIVLQGRFDVAVPGQGLQRLQGNPGGFQVGNKLAAVGMEVEGAAG